ncbi:MAG: acetoacetate--CoA ligase [Candidatus Cyclobacteriaceae bacterium M2_1C_046]
METVKKLWSPDQQTIRNANLTNYMHWLKSQNKGDFENYQELWEWSVEHIEDFWASLWQYFDIISHKSYTKILTGDQMPDYNWFEGAQLNFAEHVFRKANDQHPALLFKRENDELKEISWAELKSKVASFREYLKTTGVQKGDRVVAYIANCPEAVIGFLAANSLGAVWSSCSPDFGSSSVIDRFAQIEPKILITIDGYQYGGKSFSKNNVIKDLQDNLPTLKETVIIPYMHKAFNDGLLSDIILWDDAIKKGEGADLNFEPVPFSHPIWILYSSGTTGNPKAITHSHGGILLEHLKYLTFHNDIKEGERCFWYTTTGWMMWNYIVGSLLCGGTVVLYDGSPAYPDMNALWEFVEEAGINHFGTSAGYVVANMKADTHPGKDFDLSGLRSIGSTGSPLPPEGFDWLYKEVKEDLWLTSISGGTDVCSAFVGGNALWSVYSGEIQCRALGCKLEAFNEKGEPVMDEVGEMVITKPMPSMPIHFWNDEDKSRYKESYFEMYPGVWRHGDWTRITPRMGVVIYGRSDATLNRGGVRIGTSEIYRAVDKITEIRDSLIVCVEKEKGEFYMPLFIVPAEGVVITEDLKRKINKALREEYSPRHVPDEIISVPDIPYTISGKKVEAPVKKILMGRASDKSLNADALRNPASLEFYKDFAKQLTEQ